MGYQPGVALEDRFARVTRSFESLGSGCLLQTISFWKSLSLVRPLDGLSEGAVRASDRVRLRAGLATGQRSACSTSVPGLLWSSVGGTCPQLRSRKRGGLALSCEPGRVIQAGRYVSRRWAPAV